jgi:nucleoid-associated protein YgaU
LSVEKARITFLEPKRSGTKLGVGGSVPIKGKTEIEFSFNPKEYSIQKSAEWSRTATNSASKASSPEFKGSGPRSLTLELFLDKSIARKDVSQDVETLFACLTPYPPTLTSKKPSPPFVRFGWGKTIQFTAFLKSVSAKYTLFNQDGTPLRAVCTVTLEELPEDVSKQNPTSGGLTSLREHTVVAGDTLHSIAYEEYGHPTLWRVVAEANDVDDPLRLPPGTRLRIPPAVDALQPT